MITLFRLHVLINLWRKGTAHYKFLQTLSKQAEET
jgi:hypothetical protein